jgi:hypothetical protein
MKAIPSRSASLTIPRDRSRPLLRALAALALPFALTHCSPSKPEPSAAKPESAPAASLVTHAAKLGFASKLPADTEWYAGSTNLESHLARVRNTQFWKEVASLFPAKDGASSPWENLPEPLKNLIVQDIFFAGGKGSSEQLRLLQQLGALQNEINLFATLTSALGSQSAEGEPSAPQDSLVNLQKWLRDPDHLARLAKLVAQFEFPPLWIGIKCANAEPALQALLTEEALSGLPKEMVTRSQITTPAGRFEVLTTSGDRLLSNEQKAALLAGLPQSFPAEAKTTAEQILSQLQSKKLSLAWGMVDGYLVVSLGKSTESLQFAASPESSLLASPEWAPLLAHADKNLIALSYASASALSALVNAHPFTPMLQGGLRAIQKQPALQPLAAKLAPQIEAYSQLEAAVFQRQAAPMVSALWWDGSLQSESFGGIRSEGLAQANPPRFSHLIQQPGVILGLNWKTRAEFAKNSRAWLEALVSLLYSGVKEGLASAGEGNPMAVQVAVFEGTILPQLLQANQALNLLNSKALGGESAWVIDANGKLPSLPGLPPESKGKKLPRITFCSEIQDPKEVSQSWGQINNTLTKITKLVPGSTGFALPDPISSERNGWNTFFYGFPFFSGDLLPCSSMNKDTLFLSSSKAAAEQFADTLAKTDLPAAPPAKVAFKFDLSALADLTTEASELFPQNNPEKTQNLRKAVRWLKCFGPATGRSFEQNGVDQHVFRWELRDLSPE